MLTTSSNNYFWTGNPEDKVLNDERCEVFDSALRNLPEKQLQAILHVFVLKRTEAEAAKACGVSQQAISARIKKAQSNLRKVMAEYNEAA